MRKLALIAIPVIVAAGAGLYYVGQDEVSPSQEVVIEQPEPELTLPEKYVQAWADIELPGMEKITEAPEITGNEEADNYIRKMAEERGYSLQSIPTVELTDLQGVSMQHEVAGAWKQLQDAARAEGVYLGLVSAYRSVENQRLIFQTQLQERGITEQQRAYTSSQIIAGEADTAIDNILREYSPPGYSKHHTGYIVDITDTATDRPFEEFGQTEGFDWVSENDYANIRRFGFLPSYPEGGPPQGPDAEPWEYAWVGPSVAENL